MTQPTKFSACLALLLLVLLTSPALGFTNPKQMVASTRHTSNGVGQHQTVHLAMPGPNSSDVTRSDFFNIMASVAAFMPSVSNGFEGGVGGLGKILSDDINFCYKHTKLNIAICCNCPIALKCIPMLLYLCRQN